MLSVRNVQVKLYAAEACLSLQYGLPTLPFVARPNARSGNRGLVGNQALLDDLFRELDTEGAGRELLTDEGLSFDHPHFSTATTTTGKRLRRRLTVSLCGDPRGGRAAELCSQ